MRILSLGDSALTIEFGDTIAPQFQAAVNALDAAIARQQKAGALTGIVETMPTFRSLTVIYDPLQTSRATLEPALQALTASDDDAPPVAGRCWALPACYGGAAGPDLDDVAQRTGLDAAQVIQRHSSTGYVVYMLGFLPGFPFMGDVDISLRLPRRLEPRVRVPTGSLAIANGLTAIYPWESPGGWHLIGRCPAPLFDPRQMPPALLAAGDRVRFTPVSAEALADIEADLAAGRCTPTDWLERP